MLDKRGQRNLVGVHRDIVRIVLLCVSLCPLNLTIIDGGGLRTPAQVADNVARNSGVLKSMHLPQADGTSWAVDLLPVDGSGEPFWDELTARVITSYFFEAADSLNIAMQNGADWDLDGILGESGAAAKAGNESDAHHYQFLRAAKMPAGIDAMKRRVEERGQLLTRPTLMKGDKGDVVKLMQIRLGKLKADGDFGPASYKRLMAFQTAAKIVDAGRCGPETWRRLVA